MKSILIATMNRSDLRVKIALDREIQNDPQLESLTEIQINLDGLDVKNLENVQGDERDVVIVSTA